MQKFVWFILLASFLIIIFGGIFLWAEIGKQIDDFTATTPGVKFEPLENYEILETQEGTIVRNENAGLIFQVPNGWSAHKTEAGLEQWIININSPDLMADEKGFLTQGCGISAWVEYDEFSANAVRHRIQDPERFSEELLFGKYETTEVSNLLSLKMILDNPSWGQSIGTKTPIKNRIYVFDTRILPEEEKCLNDFNNFLNNISIETSLF